jgi:pyruvate dehydrogenase E1 component
VQASGAAAVADLIGDVPDADLTAAVRNLGGHDLGPSSPIAPTR